MILAVTSTTHEDIIQYMKTSSEQLSRMNTTDMKTIANKVSERATGQNNLIKSMAVSKCMTDMIQTNKVIEHYSTMNSNT